MEHSRLILFAALGVILYFMVQAWQQDYGPKTVTPTPSAETAQPSAQTTGPESLPPPTQAPETEAAAPAQHAEAVAAPVLAQGRQIHVTTDLLDVSIDTIGGDIRHVALRKYPVSLKRKNTPVSLLDTGDGRLFVLQSGLRAKEGGEAPTHHALYQAEQSEYTLAQGEKTLRVNLVWTAADGVQVTKTYTFHRDSYAVDLDYTVDNASASPWAAEDYLQFQQLYVPTQHHFLSPHRLTYDGPAIYDGKNYTKVSYKDLDEKALSQTIAGGWTAINDQYFLAAILPQDQGKNLYYGRSLAGDRYLVGVVQPAVRIEPGKSGQIHDRLFFGPKLQDLLGGIAPGLERTVDYGRVTIIAQPLFWLLQQIYRFVGNWGWSIILLTLGIKVVFYKLNETSGRSMAKMRMMQPRIKALQERYKDDRQRLSQAMMELYKEEGANPMGGCFPMLLQMPIFFALYWVLVLSVELRQAPWILWIHDLSRPDPYYVLPIIYAGAALIQQRLNPAPPDKTQARIMMFMPIMFLAFAAFLPAGLVLYWVVNTVLGIGQQWRINKVIEQTKKRARR